MPQALAAQRTRYARRTPGGRVHHIVDPNATATRCGIVLGPGLAVWDAALNRRVDLMPLCKTCRGA